MLDLIITILIIAGFIVVGIPFHTQTESAIKDTRAETAGQLRSIRINAATNNYISGVNNKLRASGTPEDQLCALVPLPEGVTLEA